MRSPASVVRVVVFPAPLRPTRPMRSPGCTRRVASLSRMRAPARSSRPVVVITDPRVGARRALADRISRFVPRVTRPERVLWRMLLRSSATRHHAPMHPSAPSGLPCPVCGTPATGPAAAACPTCGLPAVGQAALVVTRIGATLAELTRDRDALLATLRMSAPGVAAPPQPAPAPTYAPQPLYAPPPPPPAYAPPAPPPAQPQRRLSPQQVLLGLGALLLVAG